MKHIIETENKKGSNCLITFSFFRLGFIDQKN